MTGLVINQSFTLEFWIRPYVDESPNYDLFNFADYSELFAISDSRASF
jgi:hypothetical protein